MFTPGTLNGTQAAFLNLLAQQFGQFGMRISPVQWPITVTPGGGIRGQFVGIDPKAFAPLGDGSGTGGQITVVVDICFDWYGGGFVRKKLVDLDTGDTLADWCEPVGECGSGSGGGLCNDLNPSGSGSGSGSSSGGDPGPPVVTACGTVSTNLKVTYLGLVFTISYSAMTGQWSGFTGIPFDCIKSFGVILKCVGTDWTISPVASYTGHPGGIIVPTSLSPFLFMYSGPSISGGGGSECGTINFTISEV